MYDRIEVPRTGRWARHMQRLALTSNVELDPQINEIAKEISYDPNNIPKGMTWSPREFKALQYVMDWNGRSIIAYDKVSSGYSRQIAAIAAQQLGSKRILVSAIRTPSLWRDILAQLYPDSAISVGDTNGGFRYEQGDETCELQWFILLRKELVDTRRLDALKVDHHIVDFENSTMVEYDFTEILKALCAEFSRSTFILGCQDFWNAPQDIQVAQAKSMITHLLEDYMQMSAFHSRIPSVAHQSKTPLEYYRARGVRLDAIAFFEASGACFALVADKPTQFFRNVVSSALLPSAVDRSSRRTEMFQRYQQGETQECERLGKSLEQIVSGALDGDKDCRIALNTMQSEKWGKLKASALYSVIRDTVSTEEKTLIVASNPVIIRNIGAQTGATQYDSKGAHSLQQVMLSNFVYPHPSASSFDRPQHEAKSFNRIKTLIVENILDVDERVLEATDRLVIAEFPYDREIMQCYVDLVQVFRYRMFFATMRGTFEDYLSEQLIAPYL